MERETFSAILNRETKQARRVISHFRRQGFKGMGEDGTAFGIVCLNALYGRQHTDEEFIKIITDGDGDDSIDAIVFTKDSTDFFDFKLEENLSSNQLKLFESSLRRNFGTEKVKHSDDNIRLKAHIRRFHSKTNCRGKIRIFICRGRNGEFKIGKKEKEVIARLQKQRYTTVEVLSQNQILKKILKDDFLAEWKLTKHNAKKLDPHEEQEAYNSLIVKIPITEILKLYRTHLLEKKDLFATNVRLPFSSPLFSNGLQETIRETPTKFYLLHNGLTITATDIIQDARNYIIKSPQVVNGAQSVGNLYSIYKDDFTNQNLKNAEIVCKIIKAEEEFANNICEASNTQRPIKTEDLRTNDLFQKELELFINSSSKEYIYLRKKGLKVKRGAKKILYLKFFQWAYAALLKKPAEAKNAKSKLFDDSDRGNYRKIQETIEANLSRILNLCEIGFFVESEINKVKTKKKKGFLRHINMHLIAGIFHLNSCTRQNFNKIYKILHKFANNKISKDKNINLNKLFTKSEEAWNYLITKI